MAARVGKTFLSILSARAEQRNGELLAINGQQGCNCEPERVDVRVMDLDQDDAAARIGPESGFQPLICPSYVISKFISMLNRGCSRLWSVWWNP